MAAVCRTGLEKKREICRTRMFVVMAGYGVIAASRRRQQLVDAEVFDDSARPLKSRFPRAFESAPAPTAHARRSTAPDPLLRGRARPTPARPPCCPARHRHSAASRVVSRAG